MNKSDLKIGDVLSLNGSKAALVVESLGVLESSKVQVCWLDLDGHLQREVLESALFVAWTPPAEKSDHFPEVMAILSEAMKRMGVDSTSVAPECCDGAFEVDHRVSHENQAPQRPWTADQTP